MSTMRKLFSLILLALLATVLAACGGNDSGGSGSDNTNTSSSAATLSQTYTAPDNSITVKLPDGWEAQGGAGSVVITNDKTALENTGASEEMPADTVVIVYTVFPADQAAAMVGATDKPALKDLIVPFSAAAGDPSAQMSDPTEIQFGGKSAIRATGSSDASDVLIIVVDEGDAGFGMITVGAKKGELSKFEATALAVIESISKP